MLTLAEELLLLALHDEKGSVLMSASTALPYGLAGAILTDLTIQGRLQLVDGKFVAADSRLTGDDILDDALTKITQSKKTHKPGHWVNKLSGMKKLKERLFERLIQKGILKKEERKVLFVIPTTSYPTVDGSYEQRVRHDIRNVVLGDELPDERLGVLISLIKACDLVNEVFPKEERKQAKQRIKEIAAGEQIGKAVSDSVRAVHAAIIVAVSVACIASTSSGN